MARKTSATPQSRQESPVRGHEKLDVNFKLLLGLLVLIFISGFVIHGSLWGWLKSLPRGTHQLFSSEWKVIAPRAAEQGIPALQVNPHQDLLHFEAQSALRLRSYGWINPEKGLIQLPIERAMQLMAEQGMPRFQSAGAVRFEPSPAQEKPGRQPDGKKPGVGPSPLQLQEERAHESGLQEQGK
jgi:hypothetical protein